MDRTPAEELGNAVGHCIFVGVLLLLLFGGIAIVAHYFLGWNAPIVNAVRVPPATAPTLKQQNLVLPSPSPTSANKIVSGNTDYSASLSQPQLKHTDNYTFKSNLSSFETLHASANSEIRLSANANIIIYGDNISIHQNGSGTVIVIGSNNEIHQNGAGEIKIKGSDNEVHQNGAGGIKIEGDNNSIHQNGSGNIVAIGNSNDIRQNGSGTIVQYGTREEIQQSDQDTIVVE